MCRLPGRSLCEPAMAQSWQTDCAVRQMVQFFMPPCRRGALSPLAAFRILAVQQVQPSTTGRSGLEAIGCKWTVAALC